MSKWPKLSETLTGNPIDVEICQACGDSSETATITRWVECDDRDQKTRVVVCLCGRCGAALIEPHPRLYHLLDQADAWPGTEAVCQDCALRDGTQCTSPAAMINGGEGIVFGPGKPTRVHLSCRPRSRSRTIWMWPKPLTTCSGYEMPNWDSLNERRCELIDKDIDHGQLTVEEAAELDQLQAQADLLLNRKCPYPIAELEEYIAKLKAEGKWVEE